MTTLLAYFFAVWLADGPALIGPFADREDCWVALQGAEAHGLQSGSCELLAVRTDHTPITLTVYTR